MRLANLDLLKAAYGRYALGAYNVCNLEQIHGLFRGAAQARAPVIVQFTRVMRNYAHSQMLAAMLRGAETIYPEVVFSVHLDHGDEERRVHREFFQRHPGEFDFMPPGRTYMEEFANFVAAKSKVLGAAGKAEPAQGGAQGNL